MGGREEGRKGGKEGDGGKIGEGGVEENWREGGREIGRERREKRGLGKRVVGMRGSM